MFRSSTDASENYKSTRTLCHSVRQPPSSVWPATVASSFPAVPAPCTLPMRPSTIRMCSSWAFPCWAFATVCRWLTRNSVAPFRRWRCARMDSTILRWSHCVRCSSKWAIAGVLYRLWKYKERGLSWNLWCPLIQTSLHHASLWAVNNLFRFTDSINKLHIARHVYFNLNLFYIFSVSKWVFFLLEVKKEGRHKAIATFWYKLPYTKHSGQWTTCFLHKRPI